MKNKITKEIIKKYLVNYYQLDKLIEARQQELIGMGPSLDEWMRGKNTVEDQAINLLEDRQIEKYKFYKASLNKYLTLLKSISNLHYRYIKLKYIIPHTASNIKQILKCKNLRELDEDALTYLATNIVKEAKSNENKMY